MSTLAYTRVHDCTALVKALFLNFLCAVMLIVYISALNICVGTDWRDNPEWQKYVDSDCRYHFYDRTLEFNGQKVQQGNVFVIYYIMLWGSLFVASSFAAFTLCLKCGTCVRRIFSLLLFGGVIVVLVGDIISIIITLGHYDDALKQQTIEDGNEILANRYTYIGLNIVILVMQTYIFLNTIYDIADHDDQAEKEELAGRSELTEDTISLMRPDVHKETFSELS